MRFSPAIAIGEPLLSNISLSPRLAWTQQAARVSGPPGRSSRRSRLCPG